jgi:hypothetical protein
MSALVVWTGMLFWTGLTGFREEGMWGNAPDNPVNPVNPV